MDASELKPLRLFDQATYARRLHCAAPAAPVTHELARRLTDRLTSLDQPLSKILNASRDGGAMQHHLQNTLPHSQLIEIAPLTNERALSSQLIAASAEVVVGNLRLTLTDDVPLELFQLKKTLKPGGTLLMTTFGVNSFGQLRHAFAEAGFGHTPHVMPLTDIASAGALLQRLKFERPVVDRDLLTLTFDSFENLLTALRAHATGNLHPSRYRGLFTPQQLARVKAAYEHNRRADGKLPLTLEVLYLHGIQPTTTLPTQQKTPKIVRITASD